MTLASATLRALEHNGDGATRIFYAALRERRFRGTRCRSCAHVPFPPRVFCPRCGASEVEWIDLPVRGELHAFTQQQRAWRFVKPDVLGLVVLPGVAGFVLTKIGAPIEQLAIGQRVEVAFVELAPELVVHEFRPVR